MLLNRLPGSVLFEYLEDLVPKHNKKIAKVLRRVFVADPGMEFYEGDYSQIEPRLFAHHSRDESLMGGYTSTPPIDAHAMAAQLLNKDRDTIAKRMNMGMFTGMYPKTFAEHMGVSLQQAKQWWDEWHAAFPGIRPFQDGCKSEIQRNGFIRTILGRKGRLESNRYAYRATSKKIQGDNADILKYKMVEVDRRGPEPISLFLSIHDSLCWQAPATPEGRAASQEVVKMMQNIQGPPINFRLPCVVDVGVGKNWGEASFGP